MSDVPRQPRLLLRSGRWTYRVRVPADLQAVLGKQEIWRSFGAVSAKEAARLARLEAVRTDAAFAEARDKLEAPLSSPPLREATSEAIYVAVRAHFHRLEQSAPRVPFDPDARALALDRAIDDAAGVHGTPIEDGGVQREALAVAADARLSVPVGTSVFWEMVSAVKRAADEYAGRNVNRAALQPVAKIDPAFADITATAPPARTRTLGATVQAFKDAPEKAGRAEKTKAAYRFRLGAWVDLLGADRPVADITRAEIKAARDTLLLVPANAGKRWPGKSLQAVAALAQRQGLGGMHPKSARLYLDSLASLFKWLVIEGEITINPALSIGAPEPSNAKARRPMTVAELQLLFTSGPFALPVKDHGWRFWTPLIALYQGMRLAEIVGLARADIAVADGVPCFQVRAAKDRRLKTAQSARVVPVHPALIEIGFLAFLDGVQAGGLLFTDLPGRSASVSANAAQKALARGFRLLFPDDRAVVFHSLRHSWTDALRNAYVSRDIAERLGGWKPSGSAFSGYGDGHRPSVLAAEIAKVAYPGLDLNHLAPRP